MRCAPKSGAIDLSHPVGIAAWGGGARQFDFDMVTIGADARQPVRQDIDRANMLVGGFQNTLERLVILQNVSFSRTEKY